MTAKQPLPPPPMKSGPGQATSSTPADPSRFTITSGRVIAPQRVLLYGPGGVGKSTLAALAPNPVFLDIEGGTEDLDIPRVGGIESFADVRACLQSTALDAFETIVVDSATKAEEMSILHTVQTVKHEKPEVRISSIEDYGFGKGYQHNYDTFLLLLADLDSQRRRGRNVILIAHDCISEAPNPLGDDFIRYEPRLQDPGARKKTSNASIRNRTIQWADHVLFVGFDVIVKDGKGHGGGTRTIYTAQMPDHIAKSRRYAGSLPFTSPTDGEIWTHIFGGKS